MKRADAVNAKPEAWEEGGHERLQMFAERWKAFNGTDPWYTWDDLARLLSLLRAREIDAPETASALAALGLLSARACR